MNIVLEEAVEEVSSTERQDLGMVVCVKISALKTM
jgi:small nuclear ribonucleoprotein (snRNP)-like protein